MDNSGSHFTLSELAKALDVKKSHIRFCKKNDLIVSRKTFLKRRVYSRYDRERLKVIFRFVILGYTKEQIIDMIGIPDKDLDENDLLMQGITYGEKKIEALETHKHNETFTEQTRITNEIEMLSEYIKNIRAVEAGADDTSSEKVGNKSRDITERFSEPKQHPIKVVSVFIAGLVLVILIGSYLYYRTGQEGTKTAKPVQKMTIPFQHR
jgi:DNA-binding transcriptional MerR regulator